MKFLVIDETDGMDTFVSEFETLDEAVEFADKDFEHLTAHDKKHRKEYYILESQNPDEDSDDHFDGNIVKNYLAEKEIISIKVEIIGDVTWFDDIEKFRTYFGKDYDPEEDGQGDIEVTALYDDDTERSWTVSNRVDWEIILEEI